VRRDAPTLFDLIEESRDWIPRAIEVWTETDRLPSITSGRNISPSTLFVDKVPDPIRVISTISQQH
jgi:hypothetical protein